MKSSTKTVPLMLQRSPPLVCPCFEQLLHSVHKTSACEFLGQCPHCRRPNDCNALHSGVGFVHRRMGGALRSTSRHNFNVTLHSGHFQCNADARRIRSSFFSWFRLTASNAASKEGAPPPPSLPLIDHRARSTVWDATVRCEFEDTIVCCQSSHRRI